MQLYSFVAAVLLFSVVRKLNLILKLAFKHSKRRMVNICRQLPQELGNDFSHIPALQNMSFYFILQVPKIVTSSGYRVVQALLQFPWTWVKNY